MMRISLDSPALLAVRHWIAGSKQLPQSGRSSRRTASRTQFRTEQLEPRTMLDAGMTALLPNLLAASDTGASSTDNLTYDRTPDLKGKVQGPASEVRLRIDGVRVATLPVTDGKWTYTVPAQAALTAGKHTIAVRPLDAQGNAGKLSKPLDVTIRTALPTASTLVLGAQSDTGVKGDGQTTYATPTLRGVAQPGRWVSVSIDGLVAGKVKSDARTGAWSFKAPRLANGVHDVTAVAENVAGLQSAATGFQVTVNGERTVMLDATGGQTVELMASHLLGGQSQGFTVTNVRGGTLQKWSAAKNAWLTIPTKAMANTDPASLQKAAAIRKISFNDLIRWTPASGSVGRVAAFDVIPQDVAGGAMQPVPAVGTVPGKVVDARVTPLEGGVGSMISWSDPTDGCGCQSTRYSVEVTLEDGRTVLYSVPSSVRAVSIVEGGAVTRSRIWGATKAGAGEARSFDLAKTADLAKKLDFTVRSAASFMDLGAKARTQISNSPTGTQFTTGLPIGGTNAKLAYLEVQALPDPTESAQGLPAGTPMIISSDSNKLTPAQARELKAHPIYASHLFPGTVGGEVPSDQVRAHFQAGERLRFAGTVDASVRNGATIVVESAQNLADGSLGPWFEEARLPVGADGGYSHDYLVPYGLNSVRVRLEYPTEPCRDCVGMQPTAVRASSVGATSTTTVVSTPIDLSGSFNAFGITTPPWQVPNNQGFDGNGNYYNSDYTGSGTSAPIPGTPIKYNNIEFPIGPIPTAAGQVGGSGNSATNNPPNFVQATGQTIQVNVDADKSDYLYLAGAASNGNQMSQAITLNFADGTTETWTQSFHDWASDGPPQSGAQTQSTNPKMPVIAATLGPITLSGLQTIDGVALAAGDRVLVKNQTYEQHNGIYVVSTGGWSRAKDAQVYVYNGEVTASSYTEIMNATTTVLSGITNGGLYFWENTNPYESDGDITFIQATPPVAAPRPFAGELLLKTEPERVNQLGNLVTTPAHIFAYCRNLHGKQLASITLPNNANIGILSAVVAKAPIIAVDQGIASLVLGTTNLTGVDLMALTISNESNIGAGGGPLTFFFADQPVKGSTTTPPTYTTKQVTVPMGQQTTIAYVAPDDSSQMTFYVQKADGSCVGSSCSTYLTDWADGSGSSSQWASNINPSLNSQMASGQHWTMSIQNAGLGYNGYLDSPSGHRLPAASGSTPAGAQFKLMTQNEINDQPPWAVAFEKGLGTVVVLVGITVLTAGTGDAEVIGVEIVDTTIDNSVIVNMDDGSFVDDRILTDSDLYEFANLNLQDRGIPLEYLVDPPAQIVQAIEAIPILEEAMTSSFEGEIAWILAYY